MFGSERVTPRSTRRERRIHKGEVVLFGHIIEASGQLTDEQVHLSHDLARLTMKVHWWNLPDDYFDGNPDSLRLTAEIQKAYRRIGPEAVSRVMSRFRGAVGSPDVPTELPGIPSVTDAVPSVVDAYPTVAEPISTEAQSYDSVEHRQEV